ncbi:MAG: hypothetical protein IKJ99_01535 [Oscillospiraceae bacterium]|nr:hypothetical protein [Oscillospiraceae bacterium]
MKTNKEMLSSILKTTQMGQVGIRSVLDASMKPGLRKALESQLREYDTIESEAHSIASERGWELPELNSGVRFMSDMMTRMKLSYDRTDSKIADMMIQGNTRGIITGLKNQHHFSGEDGRISSLAQKLLDREDENIRQMQKFL